VRSVAILSIVLALSGCHLSPWGTYTKAEKATATLPT
jgi:hypothetical protein